MDLFNYILDFGVLACEPAQWQLAERVWSTASTQSLSSVRGSPLPQLAEWLEPVPLLQEEDSAEDADWVRETGETSGTAEVSPSEGWHTRG